MNTNPSIQNQASQARFYQAKKVLITGGSSGLGQQLARQLRELGAEVAIVARGPAALAQMKQANPGLLTFQADISDKNQIYRLAAAVHSQLGELDILFNVASSLGPTPLRLLMDTDCEDFEQVLQTNLMGPFRLTKALIPSMLLRQQGQVVNISSDAAISAYPGWGAYSVSKAALDHLSRIFEAELSAQGVHFYSLDPGDMQTTMHFAAVPDADPADLKDPADSAQAILNYVSQADSTLPVRSRI